MASGSSSSDSSSNSSSDSDLDSDSYDEETTYLRSLLDNAKSNARQSAKLKRALRENEFGDGEDIIKLGGGELESDAPATVRETAISGTITPAPPPKPSWFDLPAPAEADLPRLHREIEALHLHNQIDPKRFYRKDDGDGKSIKKHFAIGTIVTTNTPFGTASTDNLPRAHRKRTLVDELVDDAEAQRYAKRKFEDLQAVRGARGKNTSHRKKVLRRPKW
ncbi:Fcf2-domain-containing protein [Suillus discolor]|uniref:Fcf2-domain-containing protein n=1 Tax=Suillus discolor TaxID=1912936 RepID=A0A9P7F018_9AGAM|nr:Fcf2-domain-containing protein [Suillus discolor]KAG2101047.1 Fcf2-domain-containing protein [Suillus discolor]